MNAPTEYSVQLASCFLEQPDRHCAAQLHKVQIMSTVESCQMQVSAAESFLQPVAEE